MDGLVEDLVGKKDVDWPEGRVSFVSHLLSFRSVFWREELETMLRGGPHFALIPSFPLDCPEVPWTQSERAKDVELQLELVSLRSGVRSADQLSLPSQFLTSIQEKTKKILDIWSKGQIFPPEVLKRLSARVVAAIAEASSSSTVGEPAHFASSLDTVASGSRAAGERRDLSDPTPKIASPSNQGAYPFLLPSSCPLSASSLLPQVTRALDPWLGYNLSPFPFRLSEQLDPRAGTLSHVPLPTAPTSSLVVVGPAAGDYPCLSPSLLVSVSSLASPKERISSQTETPPPLLLPFPPLDNHCTLTNTTPYLCRTTQPQQPQTNPQLMQILDEPQQHPWRSPSSPQVHRPDPSLLLL